MLPGNFPPANRRRITLQLPADSLRVLGEVGQVVQIPTSGPHQAILWREGRHLLCMAWLLHRLAAAGVPGRGGRLHVWPHHNGAEQNR